MYVVYNNFLRFFFVFTIFRFSYVWVLCLYVLCVLCVSHTTETIQGSQMPWKWSYGHLWITMWVLGLKVRSSAKAARDPNTLSHLSDPKIDFWLCVSVHVSSGAGRGQRHLSWHLGGRVWVTKCRCWEPNVGPPEAQCVLLTAKPSLQPLLLLLVAHQIESVRSYYWRNHMHKLNWNSAGSLRS